MAGSLTIPTASETAARLAGDAALDGRLSTVETSNLGKADKSANLSDLASAPTARTNLGLGNVSNTSDANKPVSTAQQTALDLKAVDTAVVHVTGAEAVAGVKTFGSSPIVPTPSLSDATTKAASMAAVAAEVALDRARLSAQESGYGPAFVDRFLRSDRLLAGDIAPDGVAWGNTGGSPGQIISSQYAAPGLLAGGQSYLYKTFAVAPDYMAVEFEWTGAPVLAGDGTVVSNGGTTLIIGDPSYSLLENVVHIPLTDKGVSLQVLDGNGGGFVAGLTGNGTGTGNYRSASVTVDAGSVPAGGSLDVDVAATGVKVGDLVGGTFASALAAGITVTPPTVPVAGTLRFHFANSTGAPIDPAANVYTYSIPLSASKGRTLMWRVGNTLFVLDACGTIRTATDARIGRFWGRRLTWEIGNNYGSGREVRVTKVEAGYFQAPASHGALHTAEDPIPSEAWIDGQPLLLSPTPTTLSSALAPGGGAITSLPIAALPAALASGSTVRVKDSTAQTTLSSALSTGGGAITALPVAALPTALPSGATVMVMSGVNTQTWTLSGAASAGATSLAVTSQTPGFAYPSGSVVIPMQAWTLSAAAAAAATSLAVTSQTPNFAFPSGATVAPAGMVSNSAQEALRYYKDPLGLVHIEGKIKPDGAPATPYAGYFNVNVIGPLPVGYRPGITMRVAVPGQVAFNALTPPFVDVRTDGYIYFGSTSSNNPNIGVSLTIPTYRGV